MKKGRTWVQATWSITTKIVSRTTAVSMLARKEAGLW
jgi:hypothetical protein